MNSILISKFLAECEQIINNRELLQMLPADIEEHEDYYDWDLMDSDFSFADANEAPRGGPREAEIFSRGEGNIGCFVEEYLDESICLEEKNMYRVKTAPARPLTELEEFRKSRAYLFMERAVFSSSHLIPTYYDKKYDIDSVDGQMACKTFLNLLEKLQDVPSQSNLVLQRQHRLQRVPQPLLQGLPHPLQKRFTWLPNRDP